MSASETEAGRELIAEWRTLQDRLVEWVLKLAEFDRDGLWAIDGFTNCVSWLEVKCEMVRGTAFEKVRVARELHVDRLCAPHSRLDVCRSPKLRQSHGSVGSTMNVINGS